MTRRILELCHHFRMCNRIRTIAFSKYIINSCLFHCLMTRFSSPGEHLFPWASWLCCTWDSKWGTKMWCEQIFTVGCIEVFLQTWTFNIWSAYSWISQFGIIHILKSTYLSADLWWTCTLLCSMTLQIFVPFCSFSDIFQFILEALQSWLLLWLCASPPYITMLKKKITKI